MMIDRRTFLVAAGAAGVMSLAPMTTARVSAAPQVAKKPRMVVGTQRGPATDEMIQFFLRNGVTHICAAPPPAGPSGRLELKDVERMRDHFRSMGVELEMMFMPMASTTIEHAAYPNIMLGKSPERDREIEQICNMIRVTGDAGIRGLTYNLSILGVLRTEPTVGRGGAIYSTWDLSQARQEPPLTLAGDSPAPVMWERIEYFLQRVVPVAERARVQLACHPNDPGVPPEGFRGVDRVLGTVEGLKRFVSIAESDWHGLNFCIGSIAEMLHDPEREIDEVIRYFGERRKIFNVHFRNIRGRRDKFQEVYPDEGDLDMPRVMRALRDVGYEYMVMPDHVPSHPDDPKQLQALSFAFGYIKGLIQTIAGDA